jgi:hypothetical protein
MPPSWFTYAAAQILAVVKTRAINTTDADNEPQMTQGQTLFRYLPLPTIHNNT